MVVLIIEMLAVIWICPIKLKMAEERCRVGAGFKSCVWAKCATTGMHINWEENGKKWRHREKIIIVIECARYVTRHGTYREQAVACILHPGSYHEWVSELENSWND